mmetsp:Transcript_70212/g.222607  ORF Transcript_70212/g.222607 Transcript_70212/m.222607 type:complete len:244 (+) Transcript_70212:1044-1775(+)
MSKVLRQVSGFPRALKWRSTRERQPERSAFSTVCGSTRDLRVKPESATLVSEVMFPRSISRTMYLEEGRLVSPLMRWDVFTCCGRSERKRQASFVTRASPRPSTHVVTWWQPPGASISSTSRSLSSTPRFLASMRSVASTSGAPSMRVATVMVKIPYPKRRRQSLHTPGGRGGRLRQEVYLPGPLIRYAVCLGCPGTGISPDAATMCLSVSWSKTAPASSVGRASIMRGFMEAKKKINENRKN